MSHLIQPMKAPNESITEAELPLLTYPVLVSPKLDGLRAMGKDGGPRSKTLRRFDNPWVNSFFDSQALNGLDGELVVGEPTGDDVIRRCGALRRQEGEPDAHWWLFDQYRDASAPFSKRNGSLASLLRQVPKNIRSRIHLVEHVLCKTPEEVLDAEERYLKMGYEGVMIRSVNGHYKFGRATKKEGLIFKFKRFVDREAKITGFEEGETNTNEQERNPDGSSKRSTKKAGMVKSGKVGTLLGIDLTTKQPVRINPAKMKHDERVYWFEHPEELKKQVCTYRLFEGGGTIDKPRWPTWQCWRAKADT